MLQPQIHQIYYVCHAKQVVKIAQPVLTFVQYVMKTSRTIMMVHVRQFQTLAFQVSISTY